MHPKREHLLGYLLGTLPEESAARLTQHMRECDECEATVAELEGSRDTVIERLRRKVQPDRFEQEEGCQQMLAAIEALGREPTLTLSSAAVAWQIDSELGTVREYKLLAKLGEGGMGAVYKALHMKLDKVVALKVLPPQRIKDARAVARFEREMRAVGKLDHPHIIRAMDAGEVDGKHFLVMEYVKGADLAKLVNQHGPLPVADACELIRQAAVGLDEAHRHGMVHRDIKPGNLMLTLSGQASAVGQLNSAIGNPKSAIVKVLDMGLALLSEPGAAEAEGLTSTGQLMGTLDYMAPEQGDNTHAVDIRADVYSLGATLYKLLCGRAPFAGRQYDTPVKKLMALATEPPRPIGECREGLPPGLAEVVDKMLAKKPDERFGTPAEVAAALAPFSAGANLAALLGDGPLSESKFQDDTTSSVAASFSTASTAPPDVALADGSTSTAQSYMRMQSKTRRTRRRIFAIAGVAAAAALLLGVIIFTIRTPTGRVQFRLSDPSADVAIEVDGDRIDVDADDRHYEFEVGQHRFTVSSDGFQTISDTFRIQRGTNPPIDITLVKSGTDRQQPRGVSPQRPTDADGSGVTGNDLQTSGSESSKSKVPPPVAIPDFHGELRPIPGTAGWRSEDPGAVIAFAARPDSSTERPPVATIPDGLTDAISVYAHGQVAVAIRASGKLVGWGDPSSPTLKELPRELENVVALSLGAGGGLALHRSGTVTGWGSSGADSLASVDEIISERGIREVIAINASPAGDDFDLVTRDGTVHSFGYDGRDQREAPAGASIVGMVAEGGVVLALTRDGGLVSWGNKRVGNGNFMGYPPKPPGGTRFNAIAGGCSALLANGAALVWKGWVDPRKGRLFVNVSQLAPNAEALADATPTIAAARRPGRQWSFWQRDEDLLDKPHCQAMAAGCTQLVLAGSPSSYWWLGIRL